MTKNNPFDYSSFLKMYDPKNFTGFFDPEAAGSWLKSQGIAGLDPAAILAENQERFGALSRANEDASEAFRDQIERQAAIFEQIMNEARKSVENLDLSGSDNSLHRNLKIYSRAVGTAVSLMQQLSEETRAASEEVHRKIAKQVEAAVKDMAAA